MQRSTQHEVSELRRMQLDMQALYRSARRAYIAGQLEAARVESRFEKRSERRFRDQEIS